MDGDYDDPGPDNTLGPSESLDSDDVRIDDGDVVVDAPNRWIAVVEHQSPAQRLAAGTVRRRILRPAAPVAAAPRPDRRCTQRRRRLLPRVDYRKRILHQPMANTKAQIDALITNWHKAITSRDIDALVHLKFLAKAL